MLVLKAFLAVILTIHACVKAIPTTLSSLFPRAPLSTTTRPVRPSPGNRTHYSTGLPRLGADTADLSYETTASGPVTILMPYDRATNAWSSHLRSLQEQWGNDNNITVQWKSFGEDSTYDIYVKQIVDACKRNETGIFDVVWIKDEYVGLLADCLEDLWAWDEEIAVEHQSIVARGGVVTERMVALPAELAFGILVYNADLLARYGWRDPPASVDEMEEMMKTVVVGEHASDRFDVTGWVGPLDDSEHLTTTATEWLATISTTLLSTPKNTTYDVTTPVPTVATSQAVTLFSRLTTWLNTYLISQSSVGESHSDALEEFLDGKVVFLRTTTEDLPDIISRMQQKIDDGNGFEWGVSPIPSSLDNGLGVGTTDVWYVGVYKHSLNTPASIRTTEWLTSAPYQKEKIVATGNAMIGTYPNFFLDRQICTAYGTVRGIGLCGIYSGVSLTRRPTTLPTALEEINLSGEKVIGAYQNVSQLFRSTILQIFRGETYIPPALTTLDAKLRTLLHLPPQNITLGIDDTAVPSRPGKVIPKKVGTQLMGLGLVVCVTGVVVALGRRAQRAKFERELREAGENRGEGAAEREGGVEMGLVGADVKGKGKQKEEETALVEKSEKIEI